MNGKDLTNRLRRVSPPFQPDLIFHKAAQKHMTAIVEWNDRNIKNLAFLSEFSTFGDDAPTEVIVYPDGCVKIFFECNPEEPGATVLGINSEPTKFKLKRNSTYFVFVTYSHLSMNLMLSSAELLNCQFDLRDIVSPKSHHIFSRWERIAAAASFDERVKIACEEVNRLLVNDAYSPNLSEFCSLAMCVSSKTVKMRDLEDFTGYSERHCREEFRKYFGISPKRYNRILRFQGTIKLWCEQEPSAFSRIIDTYGYYDQSHLIKELKQFTGETPTRFRSRCVAR
jgi:AraC-like DNA-binding protein